MEKSGEKTVCDFCWNASLARQSNKELQSGFAEQMHEYNEVVRMVFRRKVVKKIFIVRFWRIKPSEPWFVRIGLAPWKLNTSKAKIESIEKKQETIFKRNFYVVSLQRKHSRECNRSEASKFAKDRLEMLAFTTLYQSKFIWRIRSPTKCEAFWRLHLKGYKSY